MTDEVASEEPKPSRLVPLLLGITLGVIAASGGFLSTYLSGQSSSQDHASSEEEATHEELVSTDSTPEFIPIEPLMISFGPSDARKLLRFEAYLEVAPGSTEAVIEMMPRIMDAINIYFRTLSMADVDQQDSLLKTRFHLLKRVQSIVNEDDVLDLLVSKFLLT